MNERIEEQPYDDRHNTPLEAAHEAAGAVETRRHLLDTGDHIGNDHQESPGFTPERIRDGRPVTLWAQEDAPLPRRGGGIVHPHVQEHGIPAFGTGLIWRASVQSPERADLVNYDFGRENSVIPHSHEVTNIELRTIYAHLLETAGRVRTEMRERGMQVDL